MAAVVGLGEGAPVKAGVVFMVGVAAVGKGVAVGRGLTGDNYLL